MAYSGAQVGHETWWFDEETNTYARVLGSSSVWMSWADAVADVGRRVSSKVVDEGRVFGGGSTDGAGASRSWEPVQEGPKSVAVWLADGSQTSWEHALTLGMVPHPSDASGVKLPWVTKADRARLELQGRPSGASDTRAGPGDGFDVLGGGLGALAGGAAGIGLAGGLAGVTVGTGVRAAVPVVVKVGSEVLKGGGSKVGQEADIEAGLLDQVLSAAGLTRQDGMRLVAQGIQLGLNKATGTSSMASPGAAGRIPVKSWKSATGSTFTLYADGWMSATKKNGTLKFWKPHRPLVLSKKGGVKNAIRMAKAADKLLRDAAREYNKRHPRPAAAARKR